MRVEPYGGGGLRLPSPVLPLRMGWQQSVRSARAPRACPGAEVYPRVAWTRRSALGCRVPTLHARRGLPSRLVYELAAAGRAEETAQGGPRTTGAREGRTWPPNSTEADRRTCLFTGRGPMRRGSAPRVALSRAGGSAPSGAQT